MSQSPPLPRYDNELTHCLFCDSKALTQYHRDFRGNSICICKDCHTQFMNPQYTDEYLNEYYSNYSSREDYGMWQEALLYGHSFYLSLVERYVKPGSMLDVGCGKGHLLDAARRRKWQVSGYEVDTSAVQHMAKTHNIDVYNGNFVDIDFGRNDFDLITMHQVLEHVKNPRAYLEKIHSLLKPGGWFFVAVPNIKSLSNRLKFRLERMGIRRKRIGRYYDSDHHLLYFEPRTLEGFLKRQGFNPVYLRNCHAARPGEPSFSRFITRNITDHLFRKAAFLIIAQKV